MYYQKVFNKQSQNYTDKNSYTHKLYQYILYIHCICILIIYKVYNVNVYTYLV